MMIDRGKHFLSRQCFAKGGPSTEDKQARYTIEACIAPYTLQKNDVNLLTYIEAA